MEQKDQYPDFVKTCGLGSVTGIGGANCRHSYWAFIEGVMERTYTDQELADIDPPPFQFEGREYTRYEATQKQREIERTVRKLRRRRAAFRAAGLEEDARTTSIRLNRLEEEYHRFSEAAGLVEQRDRMNVEYVDQVSTSEAAKLKEQRGAEAPIRQAIRSGEYPLTINPEKQARHMQGTATPGRSVITIPMEELQEIINAKAGSGEIEFKKDTYEWNNRETIDAGRKIGYTINKKKVIKETTKMKLHYSKTGIHAVPYTGREKNAN